MRRFTQWALVLGLTGTLFAADPFVGTWRLNTSKSSGTIPKDETVVVQQHGKILTVEVRVVNATPENSTILIRYAAPANGGAGRVTNGPYDGVSISRISANAIEITYLSHGTEARSTRAVVSKDGRTMTSTGIGEGVGWTMVLEKRPDSVH